VSEQDAAPEIPRPTDARIPEDEGRGLVEAAEDERETRPWEETYGRGGAEPFREESWRRTLGRPGVVPGGTDWRVALRAYVAGHDRGRDAEAKLADAVRAEGGRPLPAGEGRSVRPTSPESEGWEDATAAGARSTYGVPIPDPDRLDFHRSASTWRRRLPWVRIGGADDDDRTGG